jgi:hypothetical protein
VPTLLRADFHCDNIEVLEEVGPSMLVDGMIPISDEVERTSGFEPAIPVQWAVGDGHWEYDLLVRTISVDSSTCGTRGWSW